MKDNPINNYIIILILTKIAKELDSAIVIVDIQESIPMGPYFGPVDNITD